MVKAYRCETASNPSLPWIEMKVRAKVSHRLDDLRVLLHSCISRFRIHKPLEGEVREVDEFAQLSG